MYSVSWTRSNVASILRGRQMIGVVKFCPDQDGFHFELLTLGDENPLVYPTPKLRTLEEVNAFVAGLGAQLQGG